MEPWLSGVDSGPAVDLIGWKGPLSAGAENTPDRLRVCVQLRSPFILPTYFFIYFFLYFFIYLSLSFSSTLSLSLSQKHTHMHTHTHFYKETIFKINKGHIFYILFGWLHMCVFLSETGQHETWWHTDGDKQRYTDEHLNDFLTPP